MLYPKLCYNEPCYKEVEVYMYGKQIRCPNRVNMVALPMKEASVARLNLHPTGDQEVVGLTPTEW